MHYNRAPSTLQCVGISCHLLGKCDSGQGQGTPPGLVPVSLCPSPTALQAEEKLSSTFLFGFRNAEDPGSTRAFCFAELGARVACDILLKIECKNTCTKFSLNTKKKGI